MRGVFCLVLFVAGCTVFTSGDVEQCSTDSDCREIDPGSQCVESVCVSPSDITTTQSTSDSTTTGAGGSGGGDVVQCASNLECVEQSGDLPYACISGACVSLVSEDCPTVHGDFRSDQTVVFGALAPLTGEFSDDGTFVSNGVSLAAGDFEKVVGIPGGSGGARRSVVFVVCDETVDAERAASHLIDDLGVPAILGPKDPATAVSLAVDVAVPGEVLLLTPTDSDSLQSLSDDGLIWQQNPPASKEGAANARLAGLLAPRIQQRYALVEEEPLRLAVLASDDDAGTAYAATFLEALEWNGKPGIEAFGDGEVRQFAYTDDAASEITAELIEFAPHVVVMAATPGLYTLVLEPLEDGWTADQARPTYIATEKLVGPNLQELFLGTDVSRNTRLFGTGKGLPADSDNHEALTVRYTAKFPGISYVPRSAEDAYDGAYVLAYAAVGAGNVPSLTGPAMAVGITKLLAETPDIDVGPAQLNTGFSALTAGEIDLNGAGTELNFDAVTGTNTRTFKVTCFANGIEYSTFVYYDPELDELVNELQCPLDTPPE